MCVIINAKLYVIVSRFKCRSDDSEDNNDGNNDKYNDNNDDDDNIIIVKATAACDIYIVRLSYKREHWWCGA